MDGQTNIMAIVQRFVLMNAINASCTEQPKNTEKTHTFKQLYSSRTQSTDSTTVSIWQLMLFLLRCCFQQQNLLVFKYWLTPWNTEYDKHVLKPRVQSLQDANINLCSHIHCIYVNMMVKVNWTIPTIPLCRSIDRVLISLPSGMSP